MQPGHRVLDVCAAPGGKTFTLAQEMQDTGELIACDLYAARTGLIAEGAKRLGLSCIQTQTADASVFRPELGLSLIHISCTSTQFGKKTGAANMTSWFSS